MEIYNPKEWFKAVFYVHKSDTLRKLTPYLFITAAFSYGVAYLELEYFNLSAKHWVKNITVVHNLLGFALSLLLVFRTNTAYDRWWEARKQWGALTNTSRNLALKMNALLPKDDKANRHFYRKAIPMYSQSLYAFLRSDYSTFMLDENEHPELGDAFSKKKHAPNQVASLLFKKTNILYQQGIISGEQLLAVNNELEGFTNICGACERIKNTPIPHSYSTFLKKFIVFYVATLPMGYVFSLGYFVALAVPFVFYVLASLELIAEAIEDPFGWDSDDLPIEKMAENMKKHTHEVLHP
ncbi:bestrophin [Mangrovimonas sp. CR14]|uniref:bestrophin family protein n=1 Tax=Mangrovimonas sp. CR14 TaxID=2706120 RepID=UPI0014224CAC|nr:bestrophin [Mangrovimonas sp. CR14]NIK91844.1 bestrophin [Mangrovimonas sp. CR14]